MRLLILGGAGQVGWELQRTLAPLGEVAVRTRAELDLGKAGAIREAIDEHLPDVVVNAAAYTAVDDAEAHPEIADAINHRAVATMAAMAAERGMWLVHYSTDYVFDGSGTDAFAETARPGPLNVYGRSKLAGDEAIAASGCRHLTLRTSWVHAPRGRNFVRSILELGRERDSLRVVADQIGSPTSAAHIAEATAVALRQALGDEAMSGTYHLAAAGHASWHDVARHVVDEARRRGAGLRLASSAIEPIPSSDYPRPAVRPHNSRLDTSKARRTFGPPLRDWRQGVDQTVAALVAA